LNAILCMDLHILTVIIIKFLKYKAVSFTSSSVSVQRGQSTECVKTIAS
jgi:hypothetical protein